MWPLSLHLILSYKSGSNLLFFLNLSRRDRYIKTEHGKFMQSRSTIDFAQQNRNTIHFLAKSRQELQANNWKIKKSVYGALRESGVRMFYTSIVLFFGFSVFSISSFGGTVALGTWVSVTLLFAMLSNLLLLPSLLLSLEKSTANKETLKAPL